MIRAAEAADVDAITGLERACFGVHAWSEQVVREQIDPLRRTVLVSEATTGVLAYGAISVAGEVADLERIAVLPRSRRRGLAREVLNALIDDARQQGAAGMLLEVAADNDEAIGFYDSSGFAVIDTRPGYYRGIDAVVMRLDIERTSS